jgi:hypothetical protein
MSATAHHRTAEKQLHYFENRGAYEVLASWHRDNMTMADAVEKEANIDDKGTSAVSPFPNVV